MKNSLRIAFAAIVIAFVAPPAGAAQLSTAISSAVTPVRIDACSAGFGADRTDLGLGFSASQEDANLIGASYDFTNVSSKPIATIRFRFVEVDAFGATSSMAVVTSDWTGVVDPGKSFTRNVAAGPNFMATVSKVVCSVAKVLFTDGTVWSAGQPAEASTLTYPAPAATP